jgi:hypothetical protein
VVAVVLLIVVAVVGVVLVYLWFTGYLGKSVGAAGQAGAAERFKVESASLAADGTVRLYIRNLGGDPVEVKTIYVYPAGSPNPICVKHGVDAAIPPGTVATVYGCCGVAYCSGCGRCDVGVSVVLRLLG